MTKKYRVLNIVNRNALNGGVGTVLDSLMEGESNSTDFDSYKMITTYDDAQKRPGPYAVSRASSEREFGVNEGSLESLLGKFDVIHVHGIPHYGVLEALQRLKSQKSNHPKIVNTAHSSVKQEFNARYESSKCSQDPEARADFNRLKFLKMNNILDNPSRFADTYWGSAIFRQEQILSLSDIVQHMNHIYRAQIIEEYKAQENAQKHIVIPNGIKEVKSPSDREKKKRILYVGRFSSEKGIDEFIDSIPAILQSHPDAQIRLVGGDRTGELVQMYQDRLVQCIREHFAGANEDKIQACIDRVKFLGWVSDKKILDEQYGWTDYVINPSVSESFCLTAAEALMQKRIPILTKTPALDDLYISKGIALGIEPEKRNASGIAETVNEILSRDKDSELDQMVIRGRKYAIQNYSYENMINLQLTLFRNLLSGKSICL